MAESTEQALLDALGDRAGIAAAYYDIAGVKHVTSTETRRAVLRAMGFHVDSWEALKGELTAWDEQVWQQLCEPVLVLREGQAHLGWPVRFPAEADDEKAVQVFWEVFDEGGAVQRQGHGGPGLVVREVREVNGRRHIRLVLPQPEALPIGYYDVAVRATLRGSSLQGGFRLIVAPAQCYVPLGFIEGRKIWGLSLQLYSIRSARNWGVGDFGDLRGILDWAATRLGAGVIGLNPIHALRNTRPYHISPYSPDSRLYINELYLNVERIAEFQSSLEVQRMVREGEWRSKIEALQKSDVVEYESVAVLKRVALELLFAQFQQDHYSGAGEARRASTERGRAFERFLKDEGEALRQFAVFQVIVEEVQRTHPSASVWQEWPEPLRRPDSEAVRRFEILHQSRVRFHQYVQWEAAEQLKQLNAQAEGLEMPVGLYQDLALGSDRCGADSWAFQDILALEADCGAPPDALGPGGQNWGLPPINPLRLRASGYGPFIQLLRNNLRYGGAIRVDHVMALFRLFWIPRGMPASAGTYVQYPADDLLAILALESVRARTLIIGEDLGTVPDGVREKLAEARVLSYRVFYFERGWDGNWKPPAWYPEQSLAVATTHDLPTLAGFWANEDLAIRARLGGYPNEAARARALNEREGEKRRILAALKSEDLTPEGVTEDPASIPLMTSDLCRAIYRYLGRTPAWIVLASLEDGIGEVHQANVPGTVESHPNWSRKLSVELEDLRRDDRLFQLGSQLQSSRPLT